jgi:hypothetical protein
MKKNHEREPQINQHDNRSFLGTESQPRIPNYESGRVEEERFDFKKVVVGKIDLDTVAVAWLFGVDKNDQIEIVRGQADEADLANPDILCIEVGGSGQTSMSCFDHHQAGGPEDSATKQASRIAMSRPGSERIIEYIELLDTQGPTAIEEQLGEGKFPTLSDIFSGLLLTERDPKKQLLKGIEVLDSVAQTNQDPLGPIKGFDEFELAKIEHEFELAKAVEEANWDETKSGHRLAYLETSFFGAPGALYQAGAEIVVCHNPSFGQPPVSKFTIAGNGVKIDSVLPILNKKECGWGGPPTGTIVGSPKENGSQLTMDEVLEIVRDNC